MINLNDKLNGRKIVVWGTGRRSLSAVETAQAHFHTEVSFFISQNWRTETEYFGKKVYGKHLLDKTKHFIIIGSSKYRHHISEELIALGFTPGKDFMSLLDFGDTNIQMVFIELTNHCNMHCDFCPSDVISRERSQMKESYVLKLLQEIHSINQQADSKKIRVAFHVLGEPLLNHNIFKYLDICNEYDISCELTTNCTLLSDEFNKKLLNYNNLSMHLSVQTPSASSYKLRRYEKLDFEDYMQKCFNLIEAKFKYKSRIPIRLYVGLLLNASDSVVSDTNLNLWSIHEDCAHEAIEMRNLIKNMEDFRKNIQLKYPEYYNVELNNCMSIYDSHLKKRLMFDSPESLPEEWPYIHSSAGDLTHYMFAPNVHLISKPFGLWNKSNRFIKKVFANQGRFVYNEESDRLVPCKQNFIGILSNGTAIMCCIDYDGETDLGNICDNKLEDIINCEKRMQIIEDASFLPVCQKCNGRLFAFEKTPLEGNVQEVLYGRGFLDYEDRHKINGKSAFAYVYTRIQASKIILELDFHNTNNIEFELCISEYEEDTDSFKNPDCKTITVSENTLSKIEITHDFKIGQFYRLEFNLTSNTSKDDNKFKCINMHSCTLKC